MFPESELIAVFASAAGAARDDVVVGIGDDAAVVRPPAGAEIVVCTDTLVEGVHFLPGADASALGHKALAVNLSDLAAMGAEPAWATLALTLPQADRDWIHRFATGFTELARRFSVMLVGGNTSRGPLSVTVQAIGHVPAGAAIRRDGARPGDALCVSGTLGDAALALHKLQAGTDPGALRARLERPEPRIALGLALRGRAHAAIDLSDGLSTDLTRLVAASGCGAGVEASSLPASESFRRLGGTEEMQLNGGDDYELLFAIEPDALDGLDAVRIGTVEAKAGVRLRLADGSTVPLVSGGFEHFR